MDNGDALYTNQDKALKLLLQRYGHRDSFGPYFSDRVLNRLVASKEPGGVETLYDSLRWVFVRASTLGLAVAVVLCLANVLAFHDLDVVTTWMDTLLGLPSASVSDALSYGDL